MVRTTASSKKNSVDLKPTSSELTGLVSGEDLDRTYKKRSIKYVYKSLSAQESDPYLKAGWEKIPNKKRKTVNLRKLKEIGPGFEDDVWCIFHRMGFFEMNKDSTFSIPRFGFDVSKQIDVFAREEQCICIVECKSAEKPHTVKSLGVDIDQIGQIQRSIDISINKHYEKKEIDSKFKFIWILALKNIDLSDADKSRAQAANIIVIDQNLLEYYDEFSRHFGHAAKYQFLSDLLPNREIPHLFEPIPALKGSMGNTSFYSFVIEPEKLLKFAYIAHRSKTGTGSLESYQRMAKKSRLNTIKHYIQHENGIFPTNIVINFETEHPLRFDKAEDMAGQNVVLGRLHLPNKFQCAWIIDGQHRLFAFADLLEAKTATLPVIAFENLKPEKQAELFIKINGEQRRVPTNLLNDIFSDLHWDSYKPSDRLRALISRLIIQLNRSPDSILRDKIVKVEGIKTKTRNLTLTGLSTEIKNQKLVGDVQSIKSEEITPGPLSDTTKFQEDLDGTLLRAFDILNKYYSLFSKNEAVERQWNLGGAQGGYICTNHGIQATLRVLRAIFDHLEHNEKIQVKAIKPTQLVMYLEKYTNPVINHLANATSQELYDLRRGTGESGVRDSYFTLLSYIRKEFPEFDAPGLKDWLKKMDTSNNAEAREYILDKIEPRIHAHVFDTLKATFGQERSQWWFKVGEKIRSKAMQVADREGELTEYERFITLIELKEIIEEHWTIFGETYTIDASPNDKKPKKIAWFTKLNTIRNKTAHTIKNPKGVSDEELEFVKHIFGDLQKILPR
jgi:DNA sulfur modification protein DndB